eukprot:CAMPEP_0198541892 /NCGR_PEP_ID=MMETSP1462-20131121/55474_1 /TAXON_ID=1333877 /ORGANISM="Brandtodinium nutriculum, Strain RCC3387" /LENGTH=61 /DNA_ID=CAMNT_0044272083 /DNA_START=16 /DNA_END=198 /DNA_ORIENTATION=+
MQCVIELRVACQSHHSASFYLPAGPSGAAGVGDLGVVAPAAFYGRPPPSQRTKRRLRGRFR